MKCKHKFHFVDLTLLENKPFTRLVDTVRFICEDCGLLKQIEIKFQGEEDE